MFISEILAALRREFKETVSECVSVAGGEGVVSSSTR